MHPLLAFLNTLNEALWGYVNFFAILAIGIYFTWKSRFFQFRTALHPVQTVHELVNTTAHEREHGVAPLRLYFSSVGGAVGLGNMVAVVTTVSLGGPGGLFWMWVAVFMGALVKYAEIYLGITYRQRNAEGGYDGGPMFYLTKAYRWRGMAVLFCLLMCIYSVEIYQFKVVEDVFVETFHLNRVALLVVLLLATMYVTLGGVTRFASVCSVLMPFFLVLYAVICLWVIGHNLPTLIPVLKSVIPSAFTGHAAVGGFAGSSFIMAAQYGMSNAVYSGDIGMGYDSVIQAETQLVDPKIQAKATVFSLLTDCIICTLSVLLVLSTGEWMHPDARGVDMLMNSLHGYFAHVYPIMAILFFLLGWTTVLGFLAVGVKSAKALCKRGRPLFLMYACSAFIVFSFVEQNQARLVMYISGALIMCINLGAIFRLRKEIKFN